MEKHIVLNKNTTNKVIPFNPESPYIKITKVTIPSITAEVSEELRITIACIIVALIKSDKKNTKMPAETLYNGSDHLYKRSFQLEFEIDKEIVFDADLYKLELFYDSVADEDLEIHVHYKTVNNDVALVNPFENFKRHIEQSDNVKILFSAPFGQGKSTFLNYFFDEKHKAEYEVFKVFPVNYSISHNEDVFKYIKAEILFKLLRTGVTFDKESFSYSLTAHQFAINNPIRLLSPLLKLIPKVGKDAYEIFDHLKDLFNEFSEYHKQMKIADEQKAKEFIEALYAKEGSVFEDNFYTQLIRQLLERLKADTGKDNVLIIEDLDRMDPDHIFRILNIFAAHFDAPDWEDGLTNKFGFDKIILVGDYNNIKHTFAYRYGDKVDFGGYINKYYSSAPFHYDNKAAITEFCYTLRKDKSFEQNVTQLDLLACVLSDLVHVECVTLRDLIKLKKWDALEIISGKSYASTKHSKHLYNYLLCFNLFLYLSNAFDVSVLVQKLQICRDKLQTNTKWDYDYYTRIGLPSLIFNDRLETAGKLILNGEAISFTIASDMRDDYYYAIDPINIDSIPKKFNKKDFYEVLILNAEKYKDVGGFN